MKKYILLLLALPLAALARPNADKLGICYSFDGNKLKDRGVCIVSSGNAVGEMYTNIDFNGKKYLFEFSDINKLVYHRDSFFNRAKFEEIPEDEVITCYKHKPYDICFL